MKHDSTRSSFRGFSLVETTISIGLVATVLLPVMALISTGQHTQRTSSDRVISTFIAESILAEVFGGFESQEFVTVNGKELLTESWFDQNSGPGDIAYLHCASTGRIIGSVEAADYEAGLPLGTADDPEFESGFLVKLELEQSEHAGTNQSAASSLPGKDLVMMTAYIESPAHVSLEFRDIESFTTLLRLD
jgi:uncharacterized protein (TIGR02598 family)